MANRVTQVGVEVIIQNSPSVRATQVGRDILVSNAPGLRVTQAGREIIVPNPPPKSRRAVIFVNF